tara:strand:- start:344 stop:541 length:198 start_codon:yes stop_codon:yes gene_type:complete
MRVQVGQKSNKQKPSKIRNLDLEMVITREGKRRNSQKNSVKNSSKNPIISFKNESETMRASAEDL